MMMYGITGSAPGVGAVLACVALGVIGGLAPGAASSSSAKVMLIDRSATSLKLKLQGSPATTVKSGKTWDFKPTVSASASGSRKFAISHQPAWTRFNTSTGELSGTPNSTQVGTYASIGISVTQGRTTASLSPFTIKVTPAGQSNVTLSWEPPTQNADGSVLRDLKGYNVHYGTSSGRYSQTIQVSNPGLTTYVVQNLPAGKYFFSLSSYNTRGQESSLSAEIATQVD